MAPIAPTRRAIAGAAVLAIALVVVPARPAEAAPTAAPRVLCVDSVGEATLDETLPLAGRVRALGDPRGRITGRSLYCPYGRDGRLALELQTVWVTRAGGSATVGPVGCGAGDYVVDPDGGSATLAEAGGQVEVSVEGDAALVRNSERAARFTASVAAQTAAPCEASAGGAAAASTNGTGGMLVALVALLVALVAGVALHLRRRSQRTPSLQRAQPLTDTAAMPGRPAQKRVLADQAIEGLVDRGPIGGGAGLPARLLALTALAAQRVGDDGSPPSRTDRFRRAAAAVVATPPARWRSPAVVDPDHPALAPDRAGEQVRS